MRKRILTPVILSVSLLTASPALASETPSEARRCDRAIQLARQVGWLKKDLPYLRYILHRESRCQPDSIGRNRDIFGRVTSEDLGYAQINDRSWVTYLKNQGIIRTRDDLLKPKTNLKAALELLRYSVRHGYPRWHQWRGTSGK